MKQTVKKQVLIYWRLLIYLYEMGARTRDGHGTNRPGVKDAKSTKATTMSNKIRNCEFRFKCPKTWESLEVTPIDTQRYCGVINQG